jgi:deferrochelatase/peroxidase EfeB
MLQLPSSQQSAREALRTLARRSRQSGHRESIVIGVGSGAIDKVGRVDRRPLQLGPMEEFVGDVFQASRTDADVVVQVGALSPERAAEVLAEVTHALPGLVTTWQTAIFRRENEVHEGRATTLNVFGFHDGFANPDARDRARVDDLVIIGAESDEPRWSVGASYLALRVVMVSRNLWDAEPVELQERIIGRRRDGRWLDGGEAQSGAPFQDDPHGDTTPLTSHVRTANPRTVDVPEPEMLRRSWSYSQTAEGVVEDGLMFMAYQNDLTAGFVSVQRRLAQDDLAKYLLVTGGGYFVVPPTDPSCEWENDLLDA